MALKHVYYHVRNELPVYVRFRIQDAWGWCPGMPHRDVMGREVVAGSCLGMHAHPWWIHVNVWQNQLKKNHFLKKNTKLWEETIPPPKSHLSMFFWPFLTQLNRVDSGPM